MCYDFCVSERASTQSYPSFHSPSLLDAITIATLTEVLIKSALTQAKDGRMHILGEMSKALRDARNEVNKNAPRITVITIPKEKIREVIGTGGKVIREIYEDRQSTRLNSSH